MIVRTLLTPPTSDDRSRERIEIAITEHPFCPACGEPTSPVATRDQIWLDCSSLREPKHLLRRLLTLDPLVGHTHQLIEEDLAERLAA